MCRPANEAPGAPYADTRLFVPREGVMLNLEQWARVRVRPNGRLGGGPWYRVVELAPVDVVLDVNRRPLRVPRPFVQVIPIRPRLWSVVARLRNAAAPPQDWGPRYGVCPRCASRAPLSERSISMRCPACDVVSVIGWSDSHWRVFEILSATPAGRLIAKAHGAAKRLRLGGVGER